MTKAHDEMLTHFQAQLDYTDPNTEDSIKALIEEREEKGLNVEKMIEALESQLKGKKAETKWPLNEKTVMAMLKSITGALEITYVSESDIKNLARTHQYVRSVDDIPVLETKPTTKAKVSEDE